MEKSGSYNATNGNQAKSIGDQSVSPIDSVEQVDPKLNSYPQNGAAEEEENYETIHDRLGQRLAEQHGETIYECRFTAAASEEVQRRLKDWRDKLDRAATALNARVTLISDKTVTDGFLVINCLVRKNDDEKADFIDVRVACVGNVDAGKSTLLGVLTHGELDNGRGLARQRLFRHKHESETGRTSSVGNDILGFASDGRVVNRPQHGHLDWSKVCEESSKIITFIDLAGHERYLKTTVFGMTGHQPDYCMLLVGANAGVVGMTKEHLGLALALQVPVFVVVTKVDMCPANVLDETVRTLTKLLKSAGSRKMPLPIETAADVVCAVRNFSSERLCPLFKLSSVTGAQLDLLKLFLNLLPARARPATELNAPAEFAIDDTFNVPGVGTVVSGTVLRGTIRLGETLLLGPDPTGKFTQVPIRSIQRKRLPVAICAAGQSASFALKKVRRAAVRKGMVLVHPSAQPRAAWHFSADMLVLHHPTTIAPGYQAVVHVGAVRQTAAIVTMSREQLRTGDRASVRFRFVKAPEYLLLGAKLIFREGRTKAVGTITATHPDAPPPPPAASSASKRLQKRSAAAALLAPAPGFGTGSVVSSSALSRSGASGSQTPLARTAEGASLPLQAASARLPTPPLMMAGSAASLSQQFSDSHSLDSPRDDEPTEIDEDEPMDALEESCALHVNDGAQRSKKPRRRTVSSDSTHAPATVPPPNASRTPTMARTGVAVGGVTGLEVRRQSVESSNTSVS